MGPCNRARMKDCDVTLVEKQNQNLIGLLRGSTAASSCAAWPVAGVLCCLHLARQCTVGPTAGRALFGCALRRVGRGPWVSLSRVARLACRSFCPLFGVVPRPVGAWPAGVAAGLVLAARRLCSLLRDGPSGRFPRAGSLGGQGAGGGARPCAGSRLLWPCQALLLCLCLGRVGTNQISCFGPSAHFALTALMGC